MEQTNDPFPIRASSMASSKFLYGKIVETGPKASIIWQSVFLNGLSFKKRMGGIKAALFLFAAIDNFTIKEKIGDKTVIALSVGDLSIENNDIFYKSPL